MKLKDIPLFLLLMFTLVYATVGNPDDDTWSGLYFLVNYITMFWLFSKERTKINRIIGMSLSVSVLIYIIAKYLFNFEYERYYTFVPFLLSLGFIFKIEKNG